jgi:hypothetical protein
MISGETAPKTVLETKSLKSSQSFWAEARPTQETKQSSLGNNTSKRFGIGTM